MKTSVILPVYNGSALIRETIDSIIVQEGDWELIIQDDCSTDDTYDVVKPYLSEKLKYYKNSINVGVMGAINNGIMNSSGELIRLFSHDDLMLQKDILNHHDYLETNTDIDICFSNYYKVDSHGKITGQSDVDDFERNKIMPSKMAGSTAARYLFQFGCISGTQSNITFRRLIYRPEFFNVSFKYTGDFYFLAIAGTEFSIGFITAITCKIRFHQSNTSLLGYSAGTKVWEIHQITEILLSRMLPEDRLVYRKKWSSIYGYQFIKFIFLRLCKFDLNALRMFLDSAGTWEFVKSCKSAIIRLVRSRL